MRTFKTSPLLAALCIGVLLLLAPSCKQNSAQRQGTLPQDDLPQRARFGERQTRGLLEYDAIDEASGLAGSRMNAGVLWTHNDSGNKPRLYALDEKGRHLGVYEVLGAMNRDWEDIAVGPGPREGRQYIYIGDIGDNKARHELKTVFRVPEPVVRSDQEPIASALSGAEAITFRYPDGPRDAETLIVDPLSKDIIIVTKREEQVFVYRAPWPQSTSEVTTLERVGRLDLKNVCGGDVSPSGREILIKAYQGVYYWQRKPGETIWEAFERTPRVQPYFPEPQGEAIAWQADERGYFTLSEERKSIPAFLYFYPRLAP